MDFHKQTTIADSRARPPRFPLPKQVGPYQIDSVLSKGGMSILYLGIHPETLKPIVIKVLLPKYCKNKEMAARFLNEARIIGMAHHPNIVALYGQGEWEKGLYIAMEFIQGISLRGFIQQKSLTQKRALEIILQVAYALCHLHAHGVIHRDLKPENILITESGDIKVIDFGIAHMRNEEDQQRITQKKRWMGTPIYMSPEQKENPSSVSFATDIYSLGMIAYELILGKLSHGVIHLELLPKKLRKIIDKALKENPKDRYSDIVEFIHDISQSLQSIDETAQPESSEDPLQIYQEIRRALISEKAPRWAQLEIGLALQEGAPPNGFYLDFFHLPRNQYAVVMAETLQSGTCSLMQLSILKGMLKIGLALNQLPTEITARINETVCNDPMHLNFGFCLLTLDPGKNLMSYISCEYTAARHIAEGTHAARTLATPNGALGSDPKMTILETSDNWNFGDRIILHSLGIKAPATDEWLQKNLILPPQPFSEKTLELWIHQQKNVKEHTPAIITIQRIF